MGKHVDTCVVCGTLGSRSLLLWERTSGGSLPFCWDHASAIARARVLAREGSSPTTVDALVTNGFTVRSRQFVGANTVIVRVVIVVGPTEYVGRGTTETDAVVKAWASLLS